MRDLEKYRPYLRGESKISLPLLQMTLGCSYPEAKDVLKQLQEVCWAGTQVDGIFYELNEKCIHPKELTREECQFFADQLTGRQIRALEVLHMQIEQMGSPRRERYRDAFEVLQQHGLAHIFAGEYHCSVSETCLQRIKDLQLPETEDMLLAYISNPILVSSVALDVHPEPLLELPFVPKECKAQVRDGILGFRLCGEQPRRVRFTGRMNMKAMCYELVEAMVFQRDLSTKEDYEKEAKDCLRIIEKSLLCSDEFKEAARMATKEICEEMTLSNLREIRNILLSHASDEDADDEDD